MKTILVSLFLLFMVSFAASPLVAGDLNQDDIDVEVEILGYGALFASPMEWGTLEGSEGLYLTRGEEVKDEVDAQLSWNYGVVNEDEGFPSFYGAEFNTDVTLTFSFDDSWGVGWLASPTAFFVTYYNDPLAIEPDPELDPFHPDHSDFFVGYFDAENELNDINLSYNNTQGTGENGYLLGFIDGAINIENVSDEVAGQGYTGLITITMAAQSP